jgi:hypothetical protein
MYVNEAETQEPPWTLTGELVCVLMIVDNGQTRFAGRCVYGYWRKGQAKGAE